MTCFTTNLKKLIYSNINIDNGLVSADGREELGKYNEALPGIIGAYKFELQQFATNDLELQSKIDKYHSCDTDDVVKFFGIRWDRRNDTLSPCPIELDNEATTKRQVLSSLNSVYDIFNVYAPTMNRAKLFLHKLQCNKDIAWDLQLPEELLREWNNICKQTNSINLHPK